MLVSIIITKCNFPSLFSTLLVLQRTIPDSRDGPWPDLTAPYFWPDVNKSIDHALTQVFLIRPKDIFKTKQDKIAFLRNIFLTRIQVNSTQEANILHDLTLVKNFLPEPISTTFQDESLFVNTFFNMLKQLVKLHHWFICWPQKWR